MRRRSERRRGFSSCLNGKQGDSISPCYFYLYSMSTDQAWKLRLEATGIVNVVNPIEQAARGGRFEEIN